MFSDFHIHLVLFFDNWHVPYNKNSKNLWYTILHSENWDNL